MSKLYSELILLPTFEERFDYLQLKGAVGERTFGADRYLNQILYKTAEWKEVRREIIIRDNGYDLGVQGYPIPSTITVHHINPISIDDILDRNPFVFNPENLISTSIETHKAIHYGNRNYLRENPIERTQHDTCPWRR